MPASSSYVGHDECKTNATRDSEKLLVDQFTCETRLCHMWDMTQVAGPIFGPLSTRLIEGFHFEDCLISRFYFVPNPSNLVEKDFQ